MQCWKIEGTADPTIEETIKQKLLDLGASKVIVSSRNSTVHVFGLKMDIGQHISFPGLNAVGKQLFIDVDGMTCKSCVDSVNISLSLPGISLANTQLPSTCKVIYNPFIISESQIFDAIRNAGFDAQLASNLHLAIKHMTCQSCVKSISAALESIQGVLYCAIDLATNSGIVTTSNLIAPQQIIEAIENAGFEASLINEEIQHIYLSIKHMTCMSCVKSINAALKQDSRVLECSVDLETESGEVTISNSMTPDQVVEIIENAGFEAFIVDEQFSDRRRNYSANTSSTALNPFIDEQSPLVASDDTYPLNTINSEKIVKNMFKIKGMTCASCVNSIEKHLKAHPGIVSCSITLSLEEAAIEYWTNMISEADICHEIDSIGFEASLIQSQKPGMYELQIFGMTCGSCSGKIEREISQMRGVQSIAVNLLSQSGQVEIMEDLVGIRDVVQKIEDLGFIALVSDDSIKTQLESLERTREILEWRRLFWTSLLLALPVTFTAMILPRIAPEFVSTPFFVNGFTTGDFLMLVFTIPIQFGVGMKFYKSAFKALSHNSYTMDALVVLGTSMAFIFSIVSILHSIYHNGRVHARVLFETSAMLITFVTFGRYLENSAKAQTSTALSKLLSLTPAYATLMEGKNEKKIPAEYIKKDDLLKILPGEKLPADGIVEFGSSSVDESLLTGEPLPVLKQLGSKAIAGSVNGSGVLHIRATRVGTDTTLSQIVKLVGNAQTSKAPIQEAADQIAAIFVPAVVFLGLATFFIWMFVINLTGWIPSSFPVESNWLYVCFSMSISVIVVACPCALGLATPTAIMAGTGVGAKLGILIKGGRPLSVAPKLTTVIFDKTGTLTFGKMEVAETIFIENLAINQYDILDMIAQIESNSEHPIAKSIVEYVKKIKGTLGNHEIIHFDSIPGYGVISQVFSETGNVHNFVIGNQRLLQEQNIAIPDQQQIRIKSLQNQGKTVIVAAIDQQVVCFIALSDNVRAEARDVVASLESMGIKSIMVTGDQEIAAQIVAEKCGIVKVHSEVSPIGKSTIVTQLQEAGEVVAMVGDGVNDSVAMSQSDLGIAVYGGTDVAIEAASIVLMRPDLSDVVTAIHLSKTITKRIWINFGWASIYNILMIPLAMGLLAPFGITLPAMISGMAMSLSSVSVVISSLLLQRYKKPTIPQRKQNSLPIFESIIKTAARWKTNAEYEPLYEVSTHDRL